MNFNLKKLKIFWADRTLRTITLAVVLITVMGSLRPKKEFGMYPDEYWARKVNWNKCADMVLAGDSRVLMCLSPDEMSKILRYRRIYNYGFGGGWYSPEYLQAVDNLFSPDSKNKAVVLGISPHSLTKRDPKTADFFEVYHLSPKERLMRIRFGGLMYFFSPMTFNEALKGMFPDMEESHSVRTFFANGWISMHKEPCSVGDSLKKYAGFYKQRMVDEENIANVLEAVTRWTNEGIAVYGFLPPTCKEMYEMESQESGFDQKSFVEQFTKAGGVWIDTDPAAYRTFDGSHLQDDAAVQFTRDFSRKIANIEKGYEQGVCFGRE